MAIYDIITTADTGVLEILSYSSEKVVNYGQIVSVLVRNKSFLGICITKNTTQSKESDPQSGGVLPQVLDSTYKLKEIEQILPIILPTQSLELIFKTHSFSWNKMSSIVSAVLQPLNFVLNLKDLGKLNLINSDTSVIPTNKLNQSAAIFDIYNEANILLRIMYLIRNEVISTKNESPKQILILFPDTATLSSFEQQIEDHVADFSKEIEVEILVDKYSSENTTLSNRRAVSHLLIGSSWQIVLSTRSGIFLPFKTLTQTILIEESSNNYIQEQNSLYFDSRDISYILSQIWHSKLFWVSALPSSRSLAFNKTKNDPKSTQFNIFSPNIYIAEKNNLVDSNSIFSHYTEELLENSNKPILLIHPRRGNFRVTQCQNCRYIWQCANCSASLITYKNNIKRLELLCHHCQSKFEYPINCPKCNGIEVVSYSSGIDDLKENLENRFLTRLVFKIETATKKQFKQFLFDLEISQKNEAGSPIFLTSKIFDPRIPYSSFKSIVFIQAQNLATGIDYLVTEETLNSIFNVYLKFNNTDDNHSIVFDTTNPELEILQKFNNLNQLNQVKSLDRYDKLCEIYSSYLSEELLSRKKFRLPPYYNLLLLSQSNKNFSKLNENMSTLFKVLKADTKTFQPELEIFPPYPAKLLKRKGMFTYHLLIKYPKNFKNLKALDKILKPIIADMHLQARLNPRHIF